MSPHLNLFPFLWVAGFCSLVASAGCGGGNGGVSLRPAESVNSIAFVSTRDGAPEVYRMNPDGSEQTRVTMGIGSASSPSQSRAGRIVFESERDGNSEIYVVNRDGSGLQRLTNDVGTNSFEDNTPVFSPDGKTIAWASTRDNAEGRTNIWLMDSDGQNKRQFVFDTPLSDDLVGRGSRQPTWTLDGKKLAYIVLAKSNDARASNAGQIKTLATGRVTAPDFGFGDGSHLRFDNSSKIIYSSPFTQSNGAVLSCYDLDSRTETRIAVPRDAETFDLAPDYSPDGQSIVYHSITGAQPAQIYRANADGSGATALTTQGENYGADW